MTITTTINTLW